jgi:hypothetical protein
MTWLDWRGVAHRRLDRKNPTLTGQRWQFDDIVCINTGAARRAVGYQAAGDMTRRANLAAIRLQSDHHQAAA